MAGHVQEARDGWLYYWPKALISNYKMLAAGMLLVNAGMPGKHLSVGIFKASLLCKFRIGILALGSVPKKIYRLKEDQAFLLSLELGRREKFARHPSADILLHSVGGGGDFVDTVIAF